MKSLIRICMISSIGAYALSSPVFSFGQTKAILTKSILPTTGVNISDLTAGKFKDLNIYNKVMLLNKVPGKLAVIPSSAKTATVNGVTYTLQKQPFSSDPGLQNVGSATTQQSSDGLKVCTVQKQEDQDVFNIINQFSNQSQVFVGGIYTDQSVVSGTYQRMSVNRNPMQITTELVDFTQTSATSNLQTVQSPDNTGQINQAIANLLRANQNAEIPASISSDVFEVHSAGQLSVNLSASGSVNLESLIGVPVTVGADRSFTSDSKFDFNQAAAVIVQPFFNVSVANPPGQLINGTAPDNAVYVSNVVYGRIAIITAVSTLASSDLQAAMKNTIELKDVASADASLSATAKALLESSAIKVYIFGGDANLANGVAVGSFAEFKNYVNGMKANVAGALGVPIAYQMRYVADDAPVNIKAVTDFTSVECKRATQIRMSLGNITVTNVVDFGGDEEIFGSVKANFNNKDYTLWSLGSSNYIKRSQGQSISSSGNEQFINVFKDDVTNNTTLNLKLDIKDAIEAGAEYIGASDQAKHDGFVTYTPGTVTVKLADIINANGGQLTKTYNLTEGSAQVKVTVNFKAE